MKVALTNWRRKEKKTFETNFLSFEANYGEKYFLGELQTLGKLYQQCLMCSWKSF